MDAMRVSGLAEWVTLDGAAKATGISYWRVRRLVEKQQLPTRRLGNSVLVRMEDVRREVRNDA